MKQQELFSTVIDIYAKADDKISNQELYKQVARKLNLKSVNNYRQPVGRSGAQHNLYHRKIRWIQQSLKHKKILKRINKGCWDLTTEAKINLHSIKVGQRVLAMSTKFGVCIWSESDAVFKDIIDEPIHLVLTSPPYPLKVPRAYGNVDVSEYTDFICSTLVPIVNKMAKGASVVLNISNDIFMDQSPARSTYLERLIIAIEDNLGLSKMDTLQWVSNKAPGPIAWASKKRFQLNTGYEPILWFCNDPNHCLADNRRVLQPHTEKHKKFINSGGLKTASVHADGAYRKRV